MGMGEVFTGLHVVLMRLKQSPAFPTLDCPYIGGTCKDLALLSLETRVIRLKTQTCRVVASFWMLVRKRGD